MEEASSPTASKKADELPKASNERSFPADVVTQRHALLRHISSPVVRRLFIVVRVVLVIGTYIFLWYQFLACNWCDIVCVTTQEDDNVSTSTGCAATGCPSGVDDPSVALPTGWCPLFNGFLLSGVCYGGITYMLVHWTLLGIWSGCSGYVREYHLAFTDEVLGYSEFEEMKEDIQRKFASARSSTRASGAAAEDSGEETSHLHSLARLSDFEWLRALFVFGFYIWFWVTQWGCNVPEGEYNFMTGSGGLHDGLPLSYCTLVSKMLFEDIGKAQVAYVLLAWLFKLLYACVNRRVKHAIFERGGFLDDFVGYSANAEADEQALHEIEVSVAQAAGADVA